MGVVSEAQATGAEAEIQRIYRSTLGEIYGYLMLTTGGDRTLSDDLLAETYLHATRHVAAGRGTEVTIAWLKVVAKRRFIDHLRRQDAMKRRAERLGNVLVLDDQDRRSGHVSRVHESVYEALDQLPPDQRLALVLRHLDGASLPEIAETMNRSVKAIESLLGRSRQAFRAAFENREEAFGRE